MATGEKKGPSDAEYEAAKVKAEARGLDIRLTGFSRKLAVGIKDEIDHQVSERTKRLKKRCAKLRETAGEADRLAKDRRAELDGQVNRARVAEATVGELRVRVKEQEVTITALQKALAEQTPEKK